MTNDINAESRDARRPIRIALPNKGRLSERALKLFGAPIYVRHEVVHNRFVVDSLKQQGAVFVRGAFSFRQAWFEGDDICIAAGVAVVPSRRIGTSAAEPGRSREWSPNRSTRGSRTGRS